MSHITGTDRSQLNLFPLSIDEMVGQENPVRLIDLFVNQFDFKKLGFKNAVATEQGQPPYDPSDLMKLYLYGYLNRIRSSRKLEKECERNLELIWLMKGLHPRYHTIADFRSHHPKQLKNLFRQFVSLLQGWDLIEGKLVSIDGSKFRAVNSRKNNFNEKKIERQLEYIDEKINSYLTQLEAEDKAEHGDRKLDVKKIKLQIEKQQQRKKKYESLREELKQSGEEQVSTTDKDARSMPVNHQRMDVSYNVQTANDAKHSLVVHYENTNVNDKKALVNVATETKEMLKKETLEVLADKGYHNGEQIDTCTRNKIVTYVAAPDIPRTNQVPAPAYHGDKFIYDAGKDIYTCPAGATLTTNGRWYDKKNGNKYENKVKHYKTKACKSCPVKAFCTRNKNGRLIERSQYAEAVEANAKRIDAEKEKYALRQQISEHPFGIIKRQWGYDHVLLKGKQKVEAELGLIFTAYNLRRVLTLLGFSELKKRLERAFLIMLILWRVPAHIINKSFSHSYIALLPVMIFLLYFYF